MAASNSENDGHELESLVLQTIDKEGAINDTMAFAKSRGVDHKKLAGIALSLHSLDYIKKEVRLLQMVQLACVTPLDLMQQDGNTGITFKANTM